MEQLLKDIVKDKSKVSTKIVQFLEYKNTGRTDYVTDDSYKITVVDAKPLDGSSTVKGIKLSTSTSNYSIPSVGSYGIIIFTSKIDAYVVQMSDKAYIRQETTDSSGKSTIVEMKVGNNGSEYNVNADNINMNTKGGGNFSFINDNVIITNVARIRLQVIDDDKNVEQEIILDKDNGVTLTSYNGSPIEVKNNYGSLGKLLNEFIDTLNNTTYIVPSGSTGAIVSPTSKINLSKLKIDINKLLK